jgi:hypothetical protein
MCPANTLYKWLEITTFVGRDESHMLGRAAVHSLDKRVFHKLVIAVAPQLDLDVMLLPGIH